MENVVSDVYNMLAEYMFTHVGTTREDMERAIEWFETHFWDDEYEPDEDEK